jgi:hypothetical protein
LIWKLSKSGVNWLQDKLLKNCSFIWNTYGKLEACEYFCPLFCVCTFTPRIYILHFFVYWKLNVYSRGFIGADTKIENILHKMASFLVRQRVCSNAENTGCCPLYPHSFLRPRRFPRPPTASWDQGGSKTQHISFTSTYAKTLIRRWHRFHIACYIVTFCLKFQNMNKCFWLTPNFNKLISCH